MCRKIGAQTHMPQVRPGRLNANTCMQPELENAVFSTDYKNHTRLQQAYRDRIPLFRQLVVMQAQAPPRSGHFQCTKPPKSRHHAKQKKELQHTVEGLGDRDGMALTMQGAMLTKSTLAGFTPTVNSYMGDIFSTMKRPKVGSGDATNRSQPKATSKI